jgi:hypothetical protein
MKEPNNPVKIIKDSQVIEPETFKDIKPPFIFKTESVELYINDGDKPNYFKRKKNKGSFNLGTGTIELELIEIKYRIEKIDKDGKKIGYWIDSTGKEIKE